MIKIDFKFTLRQNSTRIVLVRKFLVVVRGFFIFITQSSTEKSRRFTENMVMWAFRCWSHRGGRRRRTSRSGTITYMLSVLSPFFVSSNLYYLQ